MLKLFSKSNPNNGFKKVKLRSFNQFQPRLLESLGLLLKKYRSYTYTAPADHILVKLIQTYGDIPTDMKDEVFIDSLFDITPRIANSIGMTSEINKGKVFRGEFYNKATKELIVLYSEKFDTEVANEYWEELQPVKVMRHPFINTGLEIPGPNFSEVTNEAVVIGINLPLLLFQYRKFFMFEEAAFMAGSLPRNIFNYVASYAIPNMLFTHVEQVILNRFFAIYKNGKASNASVKQPVNLLEWGTALDRELAARASVIKKTSVSMEGFLYATDGIFPNRDALAFTKLPEIAKTEQVRWLLAFSRSKLVAQMRSVTKPELDASNLYDILFETQLLKSKHVYNGVLDGDLIQQFNDEMAIATA